MNAKIAIVGAGPSGCYTAQALLKCAPALEVDVIDAQPTPFGLVRYGVAADHQGTKGVTRQFARIFTRQGARFLGNLSIGDKTTVEDLRQAYDAVVFAAGMSGDRRLGIPGDDLAGVIGSGALTRALYEHPDAGPFPVLGEAPVIIGTGNVAIDILRLLAKTPEELRGSDLGPGPSAWLAAQRVRKITVVGRSPAASARFSPVMIKELADLANVDLRVVFPDPDGTSVLNTAVTATAGPLPVEFRFESRPVALENTAGGLHLHVETPQGRDTIAASSVISAIGFMSKGRLDRDAILRSADEPDGTHGRVYATGWFRNGPVGAIPQCREEAQALTQRILSELQPNPDRVGRRLFAQDPDIVDFDHWQQIDAQELAAAPSDRCRQKISRREELLRPSNLQDA